MTSERRNSILILIGTLILGILIGLLVPGLFDKYKRRSMGPPGRPPLSREDRKATWFADRINQIIDADSLQSIKVEAIAKRAATQIDSIESHANLQMSSVLDSVKLQLKPILNDTQWQRLQEFDARAKSSWHRRAPGGHRH